MGEVLAIQTIDNATDTIFFEAATIVSDVMKIVCVTQKMFLIPETIVFANEKIFMATEKIVSGSKTIFFASETIFSIAQKIIFCNAKRPFNFRETARNRRIPWKE
jgi:hypothetical protein